MSNSLMTIEINFTVTEKSKLFKTKQTEYRHLHVYIKEARRLRRLDDSGYF